MNESSRKNAYRVGLISSFIILNGLLLFGIGQLFAYLNTGADRSGMLQRSISLQENYTPHITWESTDNPGRSIEKQTLAALERDYKRSWYIHYFAFKHLSKEGIDDYYTKSAAQKLKAQIDFNQEQEISIVGTTLSHELSLDFYSADGQLAVFTDQHVRAYEQVYEKNVFINDLIATDAYKVVMLLEDGFWKIRHRVKKEALPFKALTEATINSTAEKATHIAAKTKGINYYPQKHPWDLFGENFDPVALKVDFEIIQKMGWNTIRVFVPYTDFGGPKVVPRQLQQLQELLMIAHAKRLGVVLTLFDFYGDYSVLDWSQTRHHLQIVVNALKAYPALLAWDLKNEPDLDFESRGKQTVTAWLREMSFQLKQLDTKHPITIGWSTIEAAKELQEEVDLVSFHYYEAIADFQTQFDVFKNVVKKPLLLQEFGMSSDIGFWNPFGNSEKKQATYYRDFNSLLKKNNLGYLVWTLYDFETVPSKVVGNLPWRKWRQAHFGFIDKRGDKKSSFGCLR